MITKNGKPNHDDYITPNIGQESLSYTMWGCSGNDTLVGGSNIDYLYGQEDDDTLYGNDGADFLNGGSGNDKMYGGLKDDTYYVDSQLDRVIENPYEGTDTVFSSVEYTLPANVENLTLSGSGGLFAYGNELDNVMIGSFGEDWLYGRDGNDTLRGAGDNDFLAGGKDNDTYIIQDNSDSIVENANEGTDTVSSSIDYVLGSNLENLTLRESKAIIGIGNELNNVLIGNSNNNFLVGNLGDDTLNGGKGADSMNGGPGNDRYYVDNTGDVILGEYGSPVDLHDEVFSSISYTLPDYIEDLSLTGTGNINGTGSVVNNIIAGNSGSNILNGGAGNDIYFPGSGDDLMLDNSGNDGYFFDPGNGRDAIVDTNGTDAIEFGIDIRPYDLKFSKQSNALVIDITYGNGKITIPDWFLSPNNKIESIYFVHGDPVITSADIDKMFPLTPPTPTKVGTDGVDNISTGNNGNDIYYLKKANDRVKDYSGNDTYLFNKGDGQDNITDNNGSDMIRFGAGITSGDVVFTKSNTSLIVSLKNSQDKIQVTDWFVKNSNGQYNYQIEKVQFNEGSYFTNADINKIVQQVTTFNSNESNITMTNFNQAGFNIDLVNSNI